MTAEAEVAVSVIVPVLNEETHIRRLVRSIQRQDFSRHEVIIVDGGSRDKTVEIASSYGAQVLSLPGEAEYPSRNAGAKAARGEILLFTSADVIFYRDVIRRVAERFEDPTLLALAGIRMPYDGGLQWKVEYALLNLVFYLSVQLPRPLKRFNSSSSLMAVRKPAFFRVGGFPSGGLNGDGRLGRQLCRRGKVEICLGVKALTSARRPEAMGFWGFNRYALFILENFLPFETRLFDKMTKSYFAAHRRMREEGE